MKKTNFLIAATFILLNLFIAGCSWKRYTSIPEARYNWIPRPAAPRKIPNGSWISPKWGNVILKTVDGRVFGTCSGYSFDGTIRGNTIYLIFKADGYAYWAAKMRYNRDLKMIRGKYWSANPDRAKDKYGITFMQLGRSQEPDDE